MSSSKRNLFILAGLFFLLVIAGTVLSVRSRLGPPQTSPLGNIPDADITRIQIQEPTVLVTLERRDKSWWLKSPAEDVAEESVVVSLLSTLNGLSVGSIISENKEKYSTFLLGDKEATHLQVYAKDAEKPVLDMLIGKQAMGYGSCYVRFPGKDPVHVAENLPEWLLIRPADDFRKRTLVKASDLSSLRATGASGSLSLSRSSDTWTVVGSTRPLAPLDASNLFNFVDSLRASGFVDKPEASLKTGLEKPYLMLEGESTSGPVKVEVGGKKPPSKFEPGPDARYVRVQDRAVLLLVTSASVDELVKQLKNLPK